MSKFLFSHVKRNLPYLKLRVAVWLKCLGGSPHPQAIKLPSTNEWHARKFSLPGTIGHLSPAPGFSLCPATLSLLLSFLQHEIITLFFFFFCPSFPTVFHGSINQSLKISHMHKWFMFLQVWPPSTGYTAQLLLLSHYPFSVDSALANCLVLIYIPSNTKILLCLFSFLSKNYTDWFQCFTVSSRVLLSLQRLQFIKNSGVCICNWEECVLGY